MKKFKIITLMILLLGFVASYGQQANSEAKKTDQVTSAQQLDQAEKSPVTAPILQPGDTQVSGTSQKKSSQADNTQDSPAMATQKTQGYNPPGDNSQPPMSTQHEKYSGPTPVDNDYKPDKK